MPAPVRPVGIIQPHPQQHAQAQQQQQQQPKAPQQNNNGINTPEAIELAKKRVGSLVEKSRMQLVEFIGSGSFAFVYKAIDLTDNQYYAVKCLPKKGMKLSQISSLHKEAIFMKRVAGHPNILKLHRVYENNEYFYLIMEYCEMDLYDAITKQNRFPEKVVKAVFSQLAEAVEHCHTKGVFHRDLKPENALISPDYQLKLCDFGLSTMDSFSSELGCGSMRYMAPECIDSKEGYYTNANDVWSLGVILINLLFGKNPWHEASKKDAIYSAFSSNYPNILKKQFNLTKDADNLFRKVFDKNPLTRITVQEFKEAVSMIPQFVEANPILNLQPLSSEESINKTKYRKFIEHVTYEIQLKESSEKMAMALRPRSIMDINSNRNNNHHNHHHYQQQQQQYQHVRRSSRMMETSDSYENDEHMINDRDESKENTSPNYHNYVPSGAPSPTGNGNTNNNMIDNTNHNGGVTRRRRDFVSGNNQNGFRSYNKDMFLTIPPYKGGQRQHQQQQQQQQQQAQYQEVNSTSIQESRLLSPISPGQQQPQHNVDNNKATTMTSFTDNSGNSNNNALYAGHQERMLQANERQNQQQQLNLRMLQQQQQQPLSPNSFDEERYYRNLEESKDSNSTICTSSVTANNNNVSTTVASATYPTPSCDEDLFNMELVMLQSPIQNENGALQSYYEAANVNANKNQISTTTAAVTQQTSFCKQIQQQQPQPQQQSTRMDMVSAAAAAAATAFGHVISAVSPYANVNGTTTATTATTATTRTTSGTTVTRMDEDDIYMNDGEDEGSIQQAERISRIEEHDDIVDVDEDDEEYLNEDNKDTHARRDSGFESLMPSDYEHKLYLQQQQQQQFQLQQQYQQQQQHPDFRYTPTSMNTAMLDQKAAIRLMQPSSADYYAYQQQHQQIQQQQQQQMYHHVSQADDSMLNAAAVIHQLNLDARKLFQQQQQQRSQQQQQQQPFNGYTGETFNVTATQYRR